MKTLNINGFNFEIPTAAELAQELKGRHGGLRPSKPTKGSGLIKYAWRMARFHSGHDVTMPVMCSFDLQNWADDFTGYAEIRKAAKSCLGLPKNPVDVCGIINEAGRELLNILDKEIDLALELLGEDKNKAAKVWGRALGYY